jgi:erythromycin esterase-like protein
MAMAATRRRTLAAVLACAALLAACGSDRQPAAPAPDVDTVSANAEVAAAAVRSAARPITGAASDYDPLLALTAGSRFVLLGESTHGTHEFYAERARISARLFDEQGFGAVAAEADWSEAERVNAYVTGQGGASSAAEAVAAFQRYPSWLWNNADARDFVESLRARNAARPAGQRIAFYGLDLQSPFASMDSVVAYLTRTDTAAARRARQRYACFAPYNRDPNAYGKAAANGSVSCAAPAADELAELDARYAAASGTAPALDSLFSAVMNALVVRNAEAYFADVAGAGSSWNVRDNHMADALDRIAAHLARTGRVAKIVAWVHNSHVADSRATARDAQGEVTLGRLVRERHPGESTLVGFTTYGGTVLAARAPGGPPAVQTLNPALTGSQADVFHRAGLGSFLLILRSRTDLASALGGMRPERTVGFVYLPDQEAVAHYTRSNLPQEYDAVVHVDATTALRTAG